MKTTIICRPRHGLIEPSGQCYLDKEYIYVGYIFQLSLQRYII